MTSTPACPAHSAAPLPAPAEGSRRAEIALVAAEEFTRRGYHSTRVEHIAERLSVTPGALYRHVPGKYEMFRDAVFTLAADVVAAAHAAPPGDLCGLVASMTTTTLGHRSRAALHRWQRRYLGHPDRLLMERATDETRALVVRAVLAHRETVSRLSTRDVPGENRTTTESRGGPGPGPSTGVGAVADAILAVIASFGDHRLEISPADATAWATSTAVDLALSVPSGDPAPQIRFAPPVRPMLRGGAATREAAITAAIARFHEQGYDDVTMEVIGSDVGVAASALYRHFSGKSALLTAAVDRTATLLESTLGQHADLHGPDDDPVGLLTDLLDAYVTITFSHGPELMLYYSELGTLATEDRRRLRAAQREQLARWTGLVHTAAPDSDALTARLRVQAALAQVLDGGRAAGFHPSAAGVVRDHARTTLLGGGSR